MSKYIDIVFIDGEEGRELTDTLYNVEGVVARGRTLESIDTTLEYLRQWDHETEHVILDAEPWGSSDEIDEDGDYILSSNLWLGYVGLYRRAGA